MERHAPRRPVQLARQRRGVWLRVDRFGLRWSAFARRLSRVAPPFIPYIACPIYQNRRHGVSTAALRLRRAARRTTRTQKHHGPDSPLALGPKYQMQPAALASMTIDGGRASLLPGRPSVSVRKYPSEVDRLRWYQNLRLRWKLLLAFGLTCLPDVGAGAAGLTDHTLQPRRSAIGPAHPDGPARGGRGARRRRHHAVAPIAATC